MMDGFKVESLQDTGLGSAGLDMCHEIWEREIKKSANYKRASEFADSSNLLDDVKAYYRLVLDTNFASAESENSPPNHVQPAGRYWIEPAPPFNPKPLHTGEDGELQVRIPARYMVVLQGRATLDHLTKTVAIMEEVTRTSGRKIRATDFTVYEHVVKGFSATLNTVALDAVS